MTTLGDLKTYVIEAAFHNVSDAESDRQVLRVINRALQRLRAAHSWQHFKKHAYVVLEPSETGTTFSATQGSTAVTVSAPDAWALKHAVRSSPEDAVGEEWFLVAANDTDTFFKLAAVDAGLLAATLDHAWTAATAGSQAYTLYKALYPLPDDCSRVDLVREVETRNVLEPVDPHIMDSLRDIHPNFASGTHWKYCIRNQNLEIWPPPNAYSRVSVSYEREVTKHTSSDLNTVVVDWPDRWSDLLESACQLEAAVVSGESARVPYPMATREYEMKLAGYVEEETNLVRDETGMTLGGPMRNRHGLRVSYRNAGPVA